MCMLLTARSQFAAFLVGTLLGSWLFPAGAQANVFYRDQRTPKALVAGDPLSTIGVLSKPATGTHGTAFLVSRCLILTNFHVAFTDENQPSFNERTVFKIAADSATATPILAGSYRPGMKSINDRDWALLRLDVCLGDKYGHLKLRALPLEKAIATDLNMAGYPADRSTTNLTLSPTCRIHPEPLTEAGGWRHDCASRPGNSGSPIYDREQNVIAINSTEIYGFDEVISQYSVDISNGAVPMEIILPLIQKYLEADKNSGE